MPSGEFDLIARYLTALGAPRADVSLGIGDDAAILDLPDAGHLRCACTIVPLTGSASGAAALAPRIDAAIGELADRLRAADFAPAWATLALTLSGPDENLLAALAAAVNDACRARDIAVIGGDTTAGADAVTIFLTGSR